MERWLILHGVDLGGIGSGGQHTIRIATRHGRSSPVQLERTDLHGLLARIRAGVADGRPHLWRVGAASGLARPLIAEAGVSGWRGCAEWMAGFVGARDWRSGLRTLTREEPRRRCDHDLHTAAPPTNLRVFKQTWAFVAEVLLPLANEGVRVEPMACGAPSASTTICEASVAADLHRRYWPHKGYTGTGDRPRDLREDLLARAVRAGLVVPERIGEQAIADESGELLDALMLALDPVSTVVPAEARDEGWAY